MDILKKALHISHGDDEQHKPWKDEPNLYNKNMMMQTAYLMRSDIINTKVKALSQIGDIAYIGGPDVVKCVIDDLLPCVQEVLKNYITVPEMLLTQTLRTISQLAHRNRLVQDKMLADRDAMDALYTIIGEVAHVQDSRWGCYSLLMLCNDNINAMQIVKDSRKAEDALTAAADLQLPWLVWGDNHADTLLKLLGLRELDKSWNPSIKKKKDSAVTMVSEAAKSDAKTPDASKRPRRMRGIDETGQWNMD